MADKLINAVRPRLTIFFVLTPAFHPNSGGVQMTTYKLAKWFAGLGHNVYVYSFQNDGHIEQDFANLMMPAKEGGHRVTENLLSLTAAVHSVEPDVVINQMPYEHVIGDTLGADKSYLLLGCLRNSLFSVLNNIDSYAAKVLPEIAVPFFRNGVGRRVLRRLHKLRHSTDLRKILKVYDRFVMFGPPNLAELHEFVPDYDQEKIVLIPNSVPAVLDELPAKAKRILWLGRLDYEQKRADLILPIWQKLRFALPGWYLDVVGDGPALQDLRRESKERGIEGIRFHGRQDPDPYFRDASFFIMTSAFEGFPNVLVEAQSFACIPVIFDSFPIASWMINNGKDGCLIRPFDVSAMAKRITGIIESGKMKEFMANSLENAKRFRIDAVGPMWVSLFESTLGNLSERDPTQNLD